MLQSHRVTSGSGPLRIRFSIREVCLTALLFASLAILLAYPLSIHPASLRFPTGPDGDLGWYLLAWDTHAFLHKPWTIFDANIYYPQRLTLAYGENVIGIAFFAAPVIWLTGNLPLAANFVGLLSTVLCGLGAYVLARRVGLSVAAAVISGIIWECAPPRFFRIGQMTLSSVEWIPFGLAALHAYLDDGRKRDLRLAAGFTSLQALSTGHGAIFMALSLLIFGVYRVLLGEPLRLVKRVRDLGVVGVALLLPAILAYLPYRAVQHEAGLRRGLGTWIPNYSSFLASPSHLHQFLLSLVTRTDVNATASAFLFPGYIALALAVVAVGWCGPTLAIDANRRASAFWTRAAFVIELAMLVTAAAAAVLTAGTLELTAGATRLFEPWTAAWAWMLCAGVATLGIAMGRRVPVDAAPRHERPLVILLIAALGWILLTGARSTLHAGDGLVADYFTNPAWTGAPAFSVVDSEPSAARMLQRWNGAPPERFSVRWTGFLTLAQSGWYTFATTSDDGSQLTIDNHLVVDNGAGPHSLEARSGSIHLRRGSHLVALRYVQFGGDSALTWSWSRDGGPVSVVPAWALSQRPASYILVIAARVAEWWVRIFAIVTVLAAAWYLRVALARRRGEAAWWADAFRRDATTFYATLTLLTAALALGPPYGLWQYVYWLPGFTFIRVSSRFTIVALLGLAVLAGIGFDRIGRRLTRRGRAVLATAIGVLLVAEYAAMPMDVLPAQIEVPAIDHWLDRQPKPFVVAEVPVHTLSDLPAFERQEVDYMIHSTAHWQKTVHGYSGWRSSLHWQLYSEMERFPDETSVESLSDLGVTYVVVHTDLYTPTERSDIEERLREFSCRLRLEHVEGAGRVYALIRPAAESGR
jgi:PA14 domain-containing protein